MRSLGCLGFLLVLALGALEIWGFLLVVGWLNLIFHSGGWLEAVLLQVAMIALGIWLVRRHAAALGPALAASLTGKDSGAAGRRMVGLVGAILLIVPGFFSDVLGLLFQIGFVQGALSRIGQLLAIAAARQALAKMGGGAFPGAGPFPGMQPRSGFPGMQPDDRVVRRPRILDTTAEPVKPDDSKS
ncbi:hypothetical protein LBMAG53_03680 [Planctomycetota bacterium]|nr:hypothetical protein LBMAG53_03680 [Planctomycetota bacterium]